MKLFLAPLIGSAILLLAILFFFGFEAFATACLLAILEVTLSFDNAVVNAKVLEHMTERWRDRFLTWGMVIAVFGTRLILPVLIVAAAAGLSPIAIAIIALVAPADYAHLVEGAHEAIYAFGGSFLVMVALKYFMDDAKQVHWLKAIERHLSAWGRIEALEIGIALTLVVVLSFFAPAGAQATVLVAGAVGIVLFIFMQGLSGSFSAKTGAATGGLALFLYLNVLDSAFSLDSVVGAFALTTALPIIVVGLGIGAWFVRSLTMHLLKKRTLATLRYIEHGAHWAIFGLAGSMFVSLVSPVPELVTGTIGLAFVVAAYVSSIRARALAAD